MNRLVVPLLGIVLLLSPCAVMAQRGAGRGGRNAGTGAGPTSTAADDPTVASISRAIAAQATEAQRKQFQSAAQSADAAGKLTEDLRGSMAKAAEPSDYAGRLTALKAALDKVKSENDEFLRSFSKLQTSELKDFVKKLKRATGEVDGKWKALNQTSERAKDERQKLSGEAAELAKALGNFRRQQQALGAEMGIQN